MLLHLFKQIIKGKLFALYFFYILSVGYLCNNAFFFFAAFFLFGFGRFLL